MADTTYKYLLDTNIVSELVRDPHGAVTRRIARVGETSVCTSIIVACELRYGAAKKASPRLTQQLELVLEVLPVLPWSRRPIATMASCAQISNGEARRSDRTTC